MTREPVVAGQFYAEDFESLDKQLKESFLHKLGPGALPVEKRTGEVKAIVSPHAGYMFSGPCAAWGFKEVAEAKLPDIFLMLGPSHGGSKSCFSDEDWETPFGVAAADKQLAQMLSKKTGLPIDNSAHAMEHSIEVQLPFLQFSCKSSLQKLRIVPLMISHDANPHELGVSVKDALDSSGKNVCIITSSDFTHYGVNYGYMPFTTDKKENLYKLDKGAIQHILGGKAGNFLNYVEDTGATICGALPIAVLLEAVDSDKIQLLQYYTSGDIINDYSSAVGYAAIVLK